MNDLLGESLLAILGIRPFLERQHPRVTLALHRQAMRLPMDMRREVRAYLDDEKPDGRVGKGKRDAFPYLQILDQLSRPVEPNDLENMIDAHQEPTDALDVVIPLVRALAFLSGAAPRRSKQTLTGVDMLPPSDQDVERFRRKFVVVNNPMTILARLRAGQLLTDEVVSLVSCYPALYQALDDVIGEELGAWKARHPKADLPIAKERQLSLLLQTSTADPGLTRDMQATFDEQPSENEAQPKRGSSIDLKAGSFQTSGQAAEGGGR